MTKDLEVHIIEIPKIYRLSKKEQKEELIKWIYFFENPENKKVWGYMKKEEEIEEIKEAREKLRVISEDEKMQRIVELRQKAIMDEKAQKEYARKEGLEEGLAEGRAKGIVEGRQEGRVEGRKEGKKEGRKEKSLEIAKKMLDDELKIEEIVKYTGLSKEEIQSIRNK